MRDLLMGISAIILLGFLGLMLAAFLDGKEYKSYCKVCDVHYSEEEYVYCPRCSNKMIVTVGYETEPHFKVDNND